MSNQVGDCFKFLWPFQNVRTLFKTSHDAVMPQFAMRNKTSNNFQEKDVHILLKKCTKTQNFEVLKYVHTIYT